MTDEVSLTVVNAAQVTAMFTGIDADLHALGDPLTRALARIVVPAAAAAAPHASGRLGAGHAAQRAGNSTTGQVVNTVPYAGFVHNGTRYLAGRPWLSDTLQRTMPDWTDAVTADLQGELDEKASRT
jgi:hypothetical protein